jgi:tetratricopeptide (TPR) repeat protein
MKSNRQKIFFIIFATVICFFAVTYFKNWGTAIANKQADELTPVIKALKSNPKLAIQQCPGYIEQLTKGVSDLKKNNLPLKVKLSHKLIADCYFASRQYKLAAENYEKVSKAEPQVARWYAKQAESLYNAGQFGDALPKVHLACQLGAETETILLKARILTKLNLRNRAVQTYQEAIKVANFQELQVAKQELEQLLTRP